MSVTGRLLPIAALASSALAGLIPIAADAQALPSAYTSAVRYDAARRPTGTIAADPDGSGPLHFAATRTTYDSAGHPFLVEKGELASWQSESVAPSAWPGFTVFSKVEMTYDALGRKLTEKLSSGATAYQLTQYSYDSRGRLACTAIRMNPAAFSPLPTSACSLGTQGSDGPDRITKTLFDAAGRISQLRKAVATNLEQAYATYTYTPDGMQQTLSDADGNLTTYTYDGFDRLVAWAFPSKTVTGSSAACTIGTIGESIDGFGNMVVGPTETRTAGDDCEKYAYDRNGNRAKLMKRDGNVIRYAFDALNRNTIKDIPGGTAADVYFGYDLRGLQTFARFSSVNGFGITNDYDGFGQLTNTTNNMGTATRTLFYQYDEAGNRKQLTYPDNSYVTYVYDALNRLTTIKEAGATAIVSTTYNAKGQIESQTRGGVAITLGYDGLSRPINWNDNLAGTTDDVTSTFDYNSANQIKTKTRTNTTYAFAGYVPVNRPYGVNGLNQYTTAGPATFGYDANGNLTGDGANVYNYDVENRMKTATVGGVGVTLNYDPLGRLWQVGTPAQTLELTHDGDSIVMEVSGGSLVKYVHGPGDDDPMIQYTGAGYGGRQSLEPDYQGSIVSVADATGAKVAINTYDDYGIGPSASVGLPPNVGRFQYTGQAWLAQLGLYYYKARMYSPSLGRFMQTDPIGYRDQINLYAYVGNDPTNASDPGGQRINWNVKGYGASEVARARNYLSGSATYRTIIAHLEASKTTYNIELTRERNADGFDKDTNTIKWNPYEALVLKSGKIQSPALGFGHEWWHAYIKDKFGNAFADAVQSASQVGSVDANGDIVITRTATPDGEKVATRIEGDMARELGEQPRKKYTDENGTKIVPRSTCHSAQDGSVTC